MNALPIPTSEFKATALAPWAVVVGVLVLVGLYAVSGHNFVVFHTVAELFSVVVAFTAFGVAWYSRSWIGANFLLWLGVGQLFVAIIDVAHTLVYKGSGLVPIAGAPISTQFWIAGRAIEAMAFLVAVARPAAKFAPLPVFGLFTFLTAGVFALIGTGLFPDCFIDGKGLTPFKIGAEYIIIAVFTATLIMVRRNAREIDASVGWFLSLCIAFKIVAELSFTLYQDPYGLSNFLGHIFKIISSYLFLRAIVETGLIRPQSLIFGALEREKVLAGELQRHATTLDAVLDASPDPVMMFDPQSRFRFASRAAETFVGQPSRILVGRTWREAGLSEAVMAPIESLCRQVLTEGVSIIREYTITNGDRRRCLEVQISPVGGEDRPTATVAVIRDITTRKGMEEDLQSSLDDNRVLMMEVHHRVKNNLQIVSSILQMQGWRVSDPRVRDQFEEACGRILSLAKVHELLCTQDNASAVDMALYVQTLCSDLFTMYGVRGDWVALKLLGDSLLLPLDKAVPLALIVHELVTNAIKHAFGETGGELTIQVSPEGGDNAVLVVSDDGRGMPEIMSGADDANASLGMRMVNVLAKQIGGTITINRTAGTRVTVRFPLDAPTGATPVKEFSVI